MTDNPRWRSGLRIFYLFGILLILDQASELVIALSPMHPGEVPWRFGAVGLALGKATPLLIADAMIGLAAFGRNSWTFVRIWGWFHILLGVALGLVLLGFGLDAMTLRRVVTADKRLGFDRTLIRAALVGMALALFALRAGWVSARIGRSRGSAGPRTVPTMGLGSSA